MNLNKDKKKPLTTMSIDQKKQMLKMKNRGSNQDVKTGTAKKAPGSRPQSQSSIARPNSESDFAKAEGATRAYEEEIMKLSEKETNRRFDEGDMNLNNDKKKPLTTMSIDQKKQMLKMKNRGSNQDVKTGTAKKAPGSRPQSQSSIARPNAYEEEIKKLSEKETNRRFDELLGDMNLNNDKKKPLTTMSIDQKKQMLKMKNRGSNQDVKTGTAKKAPGSRPQSQSSIARPNAYEEEIMKLSEKETNRRFDELLGVMNLNNDKKKPLTTKSIDQKKQMLKMKNRGSNQDVKTGTAKKAPGSRPQSQLSIARPNSELSDMNLNNNQKKPLTTMSIDQKKQMLIMKNRGSNQDVGHKFEKPQDYLNYLEQYSRPELLNLSKLLNCVESLRIALINNTSSWVREFGDPGLNIILKILEIGLKYNDVKIQNECLRCVEKFMINTDGLKSFFKCEKGHEIVAKCLDHKKPQVMIQAMKILGELCFLSDSDPRSVGTDKMLSAITKVADNWDIPRFLPIVSGIVKSGNADVQSMCFQLINAFLSQTDDFEFRVHLRNEIVRNGLYDTLVELQNETNPIVKNQYDIFENHKDNDLDELHERFYKVRLDLDDIQDCFEVLKYNTIETAAEPYFLSILQHLLFIRGENNVRLAYFKVIEECVCQIVLHKSGLDPDFTKKNLDIDLQPLLDELKDKPIHEFDNGKSEELKKQLEEALAAKEVAEAKLNLILGGTTQSSGGKLDPNVVSNVANALNAPPPPPMPGMGGGPPPPPMIPAFGVPRMPGMVPLPGMVPDVLPHGLKPNKKWEINWKTISPQNMSKKAFWVKVQEESSSKPAKKLDDVSDNGPYSTGTMKKVKELKVLDGKTAQNILILLGGSLKHMSFDDIKKCLLKCDDQILTENVTEQLIQYLPPTDQLNKLQQFKETYDQLTEAEQFCIKMSEVKRLLPRLKSLSFKHHYLKMVNDTKPDIVAAIVACEEVKKSKKFERILELILLFGNYLNAGTRNGQAFGFEMSFLTELTGTKDVNNKQTLLHYIVETAESKFPELLNFFDEMPHIDRASRVSIDAIQKTLKQMDASIRNLQIDITNNKVPQSSDDRFLDSIEKFANAREQCDVLQNMFKKVDNLYTELAEYYAFDKQKYTLQEFFTDLKTFKDDFLQAKKDNEKDREIEEKKEKARLAKEQQGKERQEREARKKGLIDMNPSETQEGVMDSLLEAFSTESAFSRHLKRKRGSRPAGGKPK